MCADCHSTNLRKNYDAKTKSYDTTYDIVNVSCEACHGEGSEHVLWAKNPKSYKGDLKSALSIDLSDFSKSRWMIDEKTNKPKLIGNINRTETQMCAQCHSRRAQLKDGFRPGDNIHDFYKISTLADELYFKDGQIKDEVYVYASFVQSKMYEKGVTCTDCHNSHSLERHAKGSQICYKCHTHNKYENYKHHFHKNKQASCIDCHMPSRTYMGVDPRNDHSFRIPNPQDSINYDTPNSCKNCHESMSNETLASKMKEWYGKMPKTNLDFAKTFHALRVNSDNSLDLLYKTLMKETPNIAKATIIRYLGYYPSKQTYTTTLQMLKSDDVQIKISAIQAIELFDIKFRTKPLIALLNDKSLSVRTEAARVLMSIPNFKNKRFDEVLNEYFNILNFNSDRHETQVLLALYWQYKANKKKVINSYETALNLQYQYIPTYINYSDYYRSIGDDKKALEILQKGLKINPQSADLYYALGLTQIRMKNNLKAQNSLHKAYKLNKNNAQYAYVYAVSISKSNINKTIEILEENIKIHSGDIKSLSALSYYYKNIGNTKKAKFYEQKVEKLSKFTPTFK